MAKSNLKQQLIQELANQTAAQLVQPQNDDVAQIQAQYDAWQQEQEVASIQSAYDEWLKSQTPQEVPQETPQVVPQEVPQVQSTAPVSKPVVRETAPKRSLRLEQEEAKMLQKEERQRQNVLNDVNALRQNRLSDFAKMSLGEGMKKTDGVNQLPNIADYQRQVEEASQKQREAKEIEERIANLDNYVQPVENNNSLEETAQNVELANKWLDPNYRFTKDEGQEAYAIAQKELRKLENIKPEDMTEGDRERYNAFKNLEIKSSRLNSFAVGAADQALKMAKGINNIQKYMPGAGALYNIPVLGNKMQEGIDKGIDNLRDSEAVELAQGAAPLAENVPVIGDITPYGAGKFGTQMAAYMLTNPAFDAAGAAIGGGGKLAGFVGNQIGQNVQDVALDTLPRYEELTKDGELSPEDIKTLASEGGLNAAGNLFMGAIPELVSGAGKGVKNMLEPSNADKAFRQNALEGYEKLKALNGTTENVDDLMRRVTDQRTAAAQEIERLSKQIPEVSEAKTLEDIIPEKPVEDSVIRQTPEAPKGEMPEARPEVEVIDEVKQYVNNPNMSQEANRKINDYIFQLESAADIDGDILVDLLHNIKSDDTRKLMMDYLDVSSNLRRASDPGTTEALRTQIAEMAESLNAADKADMNAIKDIKDWDDILNGIEDYKKALNGTDRKAVEDAAKALDAARNRVARRKTSDPRMKKLFGKQFGPVIGRPKNLYSAPGEKLELSDLIGESTEDLTKDFPDTVSSTPKPNVPGAEPLQFFGGNPTDEWKIRKARTNTFENQGWGDELPENDFAYRVFHEAEQHEVKNMRGDSYEDLMKKDLFDEVDEKAAMDQIKNMMDSGDTRRAKWLAEKLAVSGTEHGRGVQAFAEYNRNTAEGALMDASRVQEDIVKPWKTRNTSKVEGNSRIAKALADMGHKADVKEKPLLTHDQIKNGVLAELNKEVGSVEKYFNENDIEYLTQLAEDKSIPVWQITSEIEHKLRTGNWYTLDESTPLPKPTNRKLQNALNSLIENEVRTEAPAPTLKEITEQVRNTLEKESASFGRDFSDDDIDYLANLIHDGATKETIANALDTKLATGSFGISDETLNQVNNIFKEISQYDVNSKQFVEGQAEAYRLLANDLVPDASLFEKFEAWRYIAMLGNPKTMLRNLIGNKTFGVVTGISNNVAALAEAGIDKASKALGGEGIQRTKSVLNPLKDGDLIKASNLDADASRYRQIIGSKYEKMDKDVLRRSKSVFKSKLAQLYEKATDAGISDYKAVKKKYSTSLAGYLKANGYDKSIFNAETELDRLKNLSEQRLLSKAEKETVEKLTKDVEGLEKARDYALRQAEYATFHEDNKIASTLSKWSRTSKEEGTGIGSMLIEGIVPFKKTPANVLRSGVEYSPLGAIDSLRRTGKLIYENTGKRAGNLADSYEVKKMFGKGTKTVNKELAADVIDSWAKTLTGTGLTALGFYLYNKGALHSSDPDTKYQDQLEGHQNYAIEINGKSYTIDWAAPTVMPLMVGAELAKLWDSTGKDTEDFYNNIDGYLEAANRITDPLIETSMLQGVRDTLETAANYAKNDEAINILPLIGYNVASGYATQAVPTIGGQIARTIDPVRRSTYTDKEGMAGVFDKQIKKQMNKIPGLSFLNEEYIDTYGRTQKNSPFNNVPANLAYQMLSPGYMSNIHETAADKVSRSAYGISQDANTLPKWKSSFKIDGQRVSPKDYTKASEIYGRTQADIRAELYNDPNYRDMSSEDKEDFIKKANTLAEKAAMESIDPNFKASEEYNTFKKEGIKGLAKNFKENSDYSAAIDKYGLTKSNTKKEIFEDEGEEGLKTLADFSEYGNNATPAYKRYESAKQQIPGLTVKGYKKTLTKIDGLGKKGNKNGQISQSEMLAYLNSGSYSQEEAEKLWNTYGNDWKKAPKQKKDGTWYVPSK